MSLHHLAKHMQSAGRGEDKVLVHMTPKEVQGLQSLAMAHGGSLTINPATGLPEAGFLSSILPMIAGLALAPLTAGTSLAFLGATPFATALTVGGITGLATGSLKQGLMAGLGAYGGAGIGESLAGAAGAGAAGAAGAGAAEAATMSNVAGTGSLNALGAPAAIPGVASTAGTAASNIAGTTASGLPTLGLDATKAAVQNAIAPTAVSQITPVANAAVQAPIVNAANFPTNAYSASFTPATQTVSPAASSFADMGRGLKSLNSMDALKAFGKENMMNLGMAAAPMLVPDKFNPPKQDQGMIRPYTLSREQNPEAYAQGVNAQGQTNTPVYGSPFDSSERQYFTDQYTAGTPYKAPGPEYKATGGLTALAVGGPVEEMAAQNAAGANTMYPQAGLQSPMYSNPQVQRPMASNVLSPTGDVAVDPYTGEQKFAEGGTTSFNYNPQTQQFTRQAPPVGSTATMSTSNGDIQYQNGVGPEGQHGLFSKIAAQIAAHQPPAGSTVSGGVSTPYIQPAAPQYTNYQQAAPQMQQAQQPDGMNDFYSYMQNQMGGMQGYAGGGSLETGLASYGGDQKRIRESQDIHSQNVASGSKEKLLATQQAAKYGDFAAYKALQDAGYDMHAASNFAAGGGVSGGYNLGSYSDGGRLLRGPGDGVSDSIPAQIGNKQPARLADGEFVIPARIVSELGNGSTEAGARQLYKMMERVQHNRRKSVGKNKVAVDAKSAKFLPA